MRGAIVLGLLAACGRLGFDAHTDVTGDGPRTGDGARHADGGGDGDGSDGSALVQATTATIGTGPQTISLPNPTTSGTLLVATLGVNNLTGVGVPPGWQINANGSVTGACVAAIATDVSGTAGRQSFAFTLPGGAPVAVQISEWSGIPLGNAFDGAGFGGSTSPSSSLTMTTLFADTTAGDLAIGTFCEDTTMPTFTAGAGWTPLGQAPNVASSPSLLAEYQTGLPAQQITATATSSASTKYAAVVMTFHVQ